MITMEEFKIFINDKEKTVSVKSLKSRDAQRMWSVLRELEKTGDNQDKSLEVTDKLSALNDEFLKTYAGFDDEMLGEVTVDDREKLTSYFVSQAQKFVAGFSSASLNQDG